ncbi:hypothetical protein EMIT0P291_190087 [Pseudomonas sp. IT-P291]
MVSQCRLVRSGISETSLHYADFIAWEPRSVNQNHAANKGGVAGLSVSLEAVVGASGPRGYVTQQHATHDQCQQDQQNLCRVLHASIP